MTIALVNAFSVNMLNGDNQAVDFAPISGMEAREMLENGFLSFIGHESTATLLSHRLGIDVDYNRQSYRFMPRDQVILAQYNGPRLHEFAIELPEGASLNFWLIQIMRRVAMFRDGNKQFSVHQYR